MKLLSLALCLFLGLIGAAQTDNEVMIHGHRGCRGLLPENTMPGFYKAIDLGAGAIEIDLVCTSDGKMLISHDPYMNSMLCTKPDGAAISKEEEYSLNIYKMTLAEAQSYSCGTIAHPLFPEQEQLKSHKPSFAEFVEGVRNYCKENGKAMPLINIEIKSEVQWDGIYFPTPDEFAMIFLKEFNSLNIEEVSLIQSFDPRILEEIHKRQSGLKLMLLVGGKEKDVAKHLAELSFKPYSYNPRYSLVDAEVMQYCKEHDIELMVWTVNDLDEMNRLLDLGVRNIITDYPDKAIQLLEERSK